MLKQTHTFAYDPLNGAVQLHCSDAASFITGTILPIDGSFSSFSGVYTDNSHNHLYHMILRVK